jgi:hypothetical protein
MENETDASGGRADFDDCSNWYLLELIGNIVQQRADQIAVHTGDTEAKRKKALLRKTAEQLLISSDRFRKLG